MKKKKSNYDYKNPAILIWKLALGSGLSWEIAKLAGSSHPYLAPISVILCLQVTIDSSIRYSFHRIVGTIIGVIVTVQFASYLSINGWTLALLILIGTYIAKWLKLDETVLHQVALSILLVFAFEHKSGDYGIDRIRDTVIGAIIAVLIHMFIYPPNFTKHAVDEFQSFSNQLAENLSKVSNCLMNGYKKNEVLEVENQVQLLLKKLHTTKSTLNKASKSLKFNLTARESRAELNQYKEQYTFLQKGYQYLSEVIEILRDWSSTGNITQNNRRLWADQLMNISAYFNQYELKQNVIESKKGLTMIVPQPFEGESQKYQTLLYYDTAELFQQLK